MKKVVGGTLFLLVTFTDLLHGAEREGDSNSLESLRQFQEKQIQAYRRQKAFVQQQGRLAEQLSGALEFNDYEKVCQLLQSDVHDKWLAKRFIEKAIRYSSPEIVKAILDKMGFINPTNALLTKAVERGDPHILKALIGSRKVTTNATDTYKKDGTALHVVFYEYAQGIEFPSLNQQLVANATVILSMLLAIPDIEVNKEDKYNQTPLQLAMVDAKWPEGVRQLVEHPKIVLTSIPASVFKKAPPEIQDIMKKGIQDALSTPAPQLSEKAEIVGAITEFAFFK